MLVYLELTDLIDVKVSTLGQLLKLIAHIRTAYAPL